MQSRPTPAGHDIVVPAGVVGTRHRVVRRPASRPWHPAASAPASPDVDEDVDVETVVDPARPWDVIVWDDPINLMSYVVWVFKRVFHFSEPVARKLMLEVHEQGRALVASEPREQAEMYLQQLHGYGLQATIQRAE